MASSLVEEDLLQMVGFNVDGARAVPPEQVKAVVVQTSEGTVFVPVSRVQVGAFRPVANDGHVAVSHHDGIDVRATKLSSGVCTKGGHDVGVRGLVVHPSAHPPRKAEAEIGGEHRPVQAGGEGMTNDGAQPRVEAVAGRLCIPVCEVKPHAEVLYVDRLGDEAHPEFLREMIAVPGVVVPQEVRHRNAPVRPV